MRRDREGDGWTFRLANHEPAFGFGVFKHDVAPRVSPQLRLQPPMARCQMQEVGDQTVTKQRDGLVG